MKPHRIILIPFIMILALSACSPTEQEASPRSDAARLEDAAFIAGDGVKLPLRFGWGKATPPKAVLIALHGFNDYGNAFAGAADYFAEANIALYSYDQRGFGASSQPGIWGGLHNLVTDLHQLIAVLRERHPNVPLFVMGESMGGAVTIAAMHEADAPKVDGVILSAPAVWGDSTMSTLYRIPLWLMAHTFPSSEFTGENLEILASDNIEMLRALGRDPLVIKKTRIDAMYGIVNLMDHAYQQVPKLQIPVLLLYGANDQVIPPEPVSHAIKNLRAPYTVAYYPKGYHMLLRDLQGEVVLQDIVSWMRDRYKPLPSGYDMGWREKLLIYGE